MKNLVFLIIKSILHYSIEIYKAIDLNECINNRKSFGSTDSELVKENFEKTKSLIQQMD